MNVKVKNKNIASEIILWTAVACVLAIVLSAVGAYLIAGQVLAQDSAMILSRVITVVSVFVSAFLAIHKKGREGRLLLTLGICVGYLIVTFLCKLAFFPGESRQLLLNVVFCLGAGVIAMLLSGTKNKRRRMVATKRRR